MNITLLRKRLFKQSLHYFDQEILTKYKIFLFFNLLAISRNTFLIFYSRQCEKTSKGNGMYCSINSEE